MGSMGKHKRRSTKASEASRAASEREKTMRTRADRVFARIEAEKKARREVGTDG